jgi:hypothetical protein
VCGSYSLENYIKGFLRLAQEVTKRKFGGAQPGAGRPKGSVGRKLQVIRAAAEGALRPGKTPLDIMIKNMLHYDEKADELLHDIVQALHFSKKKPDPLALIEMLGKLNGMRMDAQRCACDAAPFVHAKLANMQVTVEDKAITRAAEETAMTDEQVSDYFNKLRMRPTTIKPLEIITLDNETGDPVEVGEED